MYHAIAVGYDGLHAGEQLRKLAIVKAEIKFDSTDSVLDVGCGTGLSSNLGCMVFGIDSSEEMVRHARKRMGACHGFAESLPFRDKSFDYVICMTAIHNFSDFSSAIREMKRVARKEIVISLLRRSVCRDLIEGLIYSHLKVARVVRESHDDLFFCAV